MEVRSHIWIIHTCTQPEQALRPIRMVPTRKQYWEERPRVTCTPFLVCYKLILASRSDSGTRLIRRSYYKVRSFSAPNSRWKNMNDGMNQRRKDGLMDSRERHRYIILFVIQRKPFLLVLETSEP